MQKDEVDYTKLLTSSDIIAVIELARDAVSALSYIQMMYGNLQGVGWERLKEKQLACASLEDKLTSQNKLNPCPFCGNKEDFETDHLDGTILHPAYRILCGYCGASTRYSDHGDHEEIWNTRYE